MNPIFETRPGRVVCDASINVPERECDLSLGVSWLKYARTGMNELLILRFEDKFPFGNMDIVDSKALGEAIRATRKRLKVTQKDLALASGTGLRFIIELEQGKPTCHLGKALGILQALGLRLQVVES
jgi:y4mF family transcriptional regulator